MNRMMRRVLSLTLVIISTYTGYGDIEITTGGTYRGSIQSGQNMRFNQESYYVRVPSGKRVHISITGSQTIPETTRTWSNTASFDSAGNYKSHVFDANLNRTTSYDAVSDVRIDMASTCSPEELPWPLVGYYKYFSARLDFEISVTYYDLVPDLTVSSASTDPSGSVIKREAAVFKFVVKNSGEKAAGKTNAQIFDGGTKLGEVPVDALSPGASSSKSFTLPTLSVGEHSLSVSVVAVSDEKITSNNSKSISLVVFDTNAYVVKFNANGGGGVMPRQICAVDQVLKLSAATVMPISGMRFAGWACSNGKRYDDEMLVFNLAEPGETVTMTAIWEMTADPNGVQLWEGGPYWATCNVGATKPEECGYYFWWGDTVGYKRNASNNEWISVKDSASFLFDSGNCPTDGKSISELRSLGYIDSTGNLVAAHDAATAHFGAPWRMPTDAEFSALMNNCTTTWTTRNGMAGRLVTGKGKFSSKSIFLPAAGYGGDHNLYNLGSGGDYWSSTPDSGYSDYAWYRYFDSGDFRRYYFSRVYGRSVRPVRGFAQ